MYVYVYNMYMCSIFIYITTLIPMMILIPKPKLVTRLKTNTSPLKSIALLFLLFKQPSILVKNLK